MQRSAIVRYADFFLFSNYRPSFSLNFKKIDISPSLQWQNTLLCKTPPSYNYTVADISHIIYWLSKWQPSTVLTFKYSKFWRLVGFKLAVCIASKVGRENKTLHRYEILFYFNGGRPIHHLQFFIQIWKSNFWNCLYSSKLSHLQNCIAMR